MFVGYVLLEYTQTLKRIEISKNELTNKRCPDYQMESQDGESCVIP